MGPSIVTRSGGNQFHGGGFYFYRDHNLAGYPALNRDPANPDPFFQRRQFGFNLGGPLRRERLFFFVNWERNDQRGVVSAQPRTPEFVDFGQIAPSPSRGTLLSARLDFRATQNNHLYLRYSHDGTGAFAPRSAPAPPALPSNWGKQQAWADQSLGALTSTLRPNFINELRFSYFFISFREQGGQPEDCPSGCIGLGWPQISVPGASFIIGKSFRGRTKTAHLWRLYWQDTWRLHPRLTMNYGLGWFYDPHPNRDLSKPAYLERSSAPKDSRLRKPIETTFLLRLVLPGRLPAMLER